MIQNKLLAAFLVFTSILIAFSGPGIVQSALAQPQSPLELGLKGDFISPEMLPETQTPPGTTDPATDEYIPDTSNPAEDQPSSIQDQGFEIESDPTLGQSTTGNAAQSEPTLSNAGTGNDMDSLAQQGMPSVIEGVLANLLWHQPMSTIETDVYVDQEFPDDPNYSSYLSDDFVVDGTWRIETIFVPGDGWSGFSSLENATALNWKIYADDGGVPGGDPSGGGALPVWSLTLAPSSPNVTLSVGYSGFTSNTLLDLPTPLELTAGHYWLVFYPSLPYTTGGQFGLHSAETSNGGIAKFINPGSGFGYGTEWQDWSAIGAPSYDIAFSIGGRAGPFWRSISPINSVGRSRPAAAAVNGKIYLFGGEISGGRADKVERYDPTTDSWTTLGAAMPNPASNLCAAVMGTDIYIPGGYDASSTDLDVLRVYHTTTNSWSVITTDPLPVALSGVGCTTLNNKLYVVAGSASGSFKASAYVYDPSATAGLRWSTLASKNTADAHLGVVTINGKIYALGGYDCPSCVEVYDPADGAWHVVSNLTAERGGVGVYAIGTNLYACGGGGWSSYLDSCESYDTNQGFSGVWKAHPAYMLQGRRTFAYANIGPVMYAIAGWNGGYMQTAERWSFDSYLPITLK